MCNCTCILFYRTLILSMRLFILWENNAAGRVLVYVCMGATVMISQKYGDNLSNVYLIHFDW